MRGSGRALEILIRGDDFDFVRARFAKVRAEWALDRKIMIYRAASVPDLLAPAQRPAHEALSMGNGCGQTKPRRQRARDRA